MTSTSVPFGNACLSSGMSEGLATSTEIGASTSNSCENACQLSFAKSKGMSKYSRNQCVVGKYVASGVDRTYGVLDMICLKGSGPSLPRHVDVTRTLREYMV
jgi:hypothetical protein